jgi:general secretion pathway protein E
MSPGKSPLRADPPPSLPPGASAVHGQHGRPNTDTTGPSPTTPSPTESLVCRDPWAPDFAESLGAFLTARDLVEPSAVDRARRAASATGERFDHVLTKLGLLSESGLATTLSEYLSIPAVSHEHIPTEPLLSELLDRDFIRRNRIMPLSANGETLAIGVTDPFNDEPIRALAFLIHRPIAVHIFAPADFDKAFDALYAASFDGADTAKHQDGSNASDVDVQRLRDLASEAPVIRLVNQIVASAVETRASDIHIEPTIDSVLIRHRIDGLLRTAQTLPPGMRAAVTSRIKIMSKLDIAERRMPQDGRIKIAVRGTDIDFRVSTIPTAFGESVVMRILDRSRVELDLAKLGFEEHHISMLAELIDQPNGILLVTGPTGSGKTTTLYTLLKMLNSTRRKIFTVEDPIEYQLPGINQVQVHPAIGLTFPHALRSILRQDPDIIMIGEIRDLETARIAVQASLTGHLVLSTLHTNSAAATITRLIDMGVENYLLASTVKGIIAQRLVRRLCPKCSRPHDRRTTWVDELRKDTGRVVPFGTADIRQPQGCVACNETGFAGRSTIAEILHIDSEIHRLISVRASDSDIDRVARERGMAGMYEDGVRKVWQAQTTIEEVLRATRVI